MRTSGRAFTKNWYSGRDCLEYSVSKDKAFCYNCRLFSAETEGLHLAFSKIGYCDWKIGKRDLDNHSESVCRRNATVLLKARLDNDNNKV